MEKYQVYKMQFLRIFSTVHDNSILCQFLSWMELNTCPKEPSPWGKQVARPRKIPSLPRPAGTGGAKMTRDQEQIHFSFTIFKYSFVNNLLKNWLFSCRFALPQPQPRPSLFYPFPAAPHIPDEVVGVGGSQNQQTSRTIRGSKNDPTGLWSKQYLNRM